VTKKDGRFGGVKNEEGNCPRALSFWGADFIGESGSTKIHPTSQGDSGGAVEEEEY